MQETNHNKSAKQDLVLAPGPVNLHPSVQTALALPMIHHRTPEFDLILREALAKLKKVFQTDQPVFISTSTGSGGMECLLVNTLSKGDLVLCIESGKFGERWKEMAQTYGAEVHTLKVNWGEAVNPNDVHEFLKKNPRTSLVLCQACETSTGTSHPIEALGKIIQQFKDTLFLVDGITALGAEPLPMKDWFIDGLVGGSQKAFMLPTGMSLLSFSEKAWKKVLVADTPRYYFDVRRELKANQKGETFFSSNVTLIRALNVVLDLILKPDLSGHFAEIKQRGDFARDIAQLMGFTLFSKAPARALTALTVPDGFDSQKIRLQLEKNHHITIMGGQDQAQGKILRIGHMGYIQWPQMIDLMEKIYLTMTEINPSWKAPITLTELQKKMREYKTHG